MNRSLNELVIDGIDTTKDLHKKLLLPNLSRNMTLALIG